MSIVHLVKGIDPVTERLKNKALQHRILEPNDENRALLREYELLVKQINDIPARLYGLKYNYRRRDMPTQIAKLTLEREVKMSALLELEKKLFPPQ